LNYNESIDSQLRACARIASLCVAMNCALCRPSL